MACYLTNFDLPSVKYRDIHKKIQISKTQLKIAFLKSCPYLHGDNDIKEIRGLHKSSGKS